MNYDNFTLLAQKALKKGSQLAKEKENKYIENGHILKGIFTIDKNVTPFILRKLKIDYQEVNEQLDIIINAYPALKQGGKLSVSKHVETSLNKALKIAKDLGDDYISVEHIFSGILVTGDHIAKFLTDKGISENKLEKIIEELRKGKVIDHKKQDSYIALNQFARNLNKQAEEGKLDPVVGRTEEIRRILHIISRRRKNNPIIIGEPGVGKTAVIEGLAHRLVQGDVPDNLKGNQIYSLDMGSLIAGASKQGQFEERLKSLIREVEESAGDIILFIDEIHLLIGAGKGAGAMDAANILKPALARGTLKVLGATTINEFKKYFEKDKALVRRFQKIVIDEPTIEDTISILRGIKEKYEVHHNIQIKDDALIAAAELSHRYITERFLPDKAIDLIDEASSKLRLELNTKPDEIDEVERKIIQLQIEKETIKKENDEFKIKELQTKITELSDERSQLRAVWESQKQIIDDILETKKQIEELKKEAKKAEDDAEFDKVAEIRYGKLKELNEKLNDYSQELEDNNSEAILLKEHVDRDLISEIVSSHTGIPVNKMMQDEKDKLLRLEEELAKRVIGQKDAIRAVSNAIRRNRAGLGDEKKPIGSFIFLGTTGVGKTELAKALAEFLFDDEKAMTRIDMSEYQEQHTVSKLIGSPPGYVGHDEGGQLTEAVRLHPYSVVLFDEMEKAHKDIFNTLLQVLDDGRLTDSKGVTVNFKNTLIIMTSNAGSDKIMANFQELTKGNMREIVEKSKQDVSKVLKETMPPEFLNRIDEIIMFTPLSIGEIRKIVNLQLNSLKKRLSNQEIKIHLTSLAINYLTRLSYNPQFGARPVKRSIQRHLLDELSKKVLGGEVVKEKIILIDIKENKFHFSNLTNEELDLFIKDEKKEAEEKLGELKVKDDNKSEILKSGDLNKDKPGFWKRFGNWFKNIFQKKNKSE